MIYVFSALRDVLLFHVYLVSHLGRGVVNDSHPCRIEWQNWQVSLLNKYRYMLFNILHSSPWSHIFCFIYFFPSPFEIWHWDIFSILSNIPISSLIFIFNCGIQILELGFTSSPCQRGYSNMNLRSFYRISFFFSSPSLICERHDVINWRRLETT